MDPSSDPRSHCRPALPRRAMLSTAAVWGVVGAVAHLLSPVAHAATTPTSGQGLFYITGTGTPADNGDYIDNGLGSSTRIFLEVPPSLPRLRVGIYDADVCGVASEQNETSSIDRCPGAQDGTASYQLFDPSGASVATLTTTSASSGNGGWTVLYNATAAGYYDSFATGGYTGTAGAIDWSTTAWSETNDNANATSGLILITGGNPYLRLREGNPAGDSTITRLADTSTFSSVQLQWRWRTANTVDAGDTVVAEVSTDNFASTTTAGTLVGSNTTFATVTVNLPASFISSTFRIRFRVVSGYTGTEEVRIDDVRVQEPLEAGHWELRAAMTAGNDTNAFGVYAHDQNNSTPSATGTEVKAYVDSLASVGTNGINSNRTITFYPYVTEGCSCNLNTYDVDREIGSNSTSYAFTGFDTTTAFTQTVANASLSTNGAWTSNSITGYLPAATRPTVEDYGIWRVIVASNATGGGAPANYHTFFVSNTSAANPPTSNPATGAFRLYLPTDTAVAPTKPNLRQYVRDSGTATIAVGTPRQVTVTVTLRNPGVAAIDFDSDLLNQVTVNVPSAPSNGTVTYVGGSASTTTGAIISEPADGASGDIVWDPGTIAASASALHLLSYDVIVTPTGSGSVNVTGTGANGTRARYVDETSNQVQARALTDIGPLCDLTVTTGVATYALIRDVNVERRGGDSVLQFDTVTEVGTGAIEVDLVTEAGRERLGTVYASVDAPQGAHYELFVPHKLNDIAELELTEVTRAGSRNSLGTFFTQLNAEPTQTRVSGRVPALRFPHPSVRILQTLDADPLARPVTGVARARIPADGAALLPFVQIASALGVDEATVRQAVADGALEVERAGRAVAPVPTADGVLVIGNGAPSVAFLRLGSGQVPVTVDASAAGAPADATVRGRYVAEEDAFPAPAAASGSDRDLWYWQSVMDVDGARVATFPLLTAGLTAGNSATLRLFAHGSGPGVTGAEVSVNGVFIGTVHADPRADLEVALDVPAQALSGDETVVEFSALSGTADAGALFIDRLELDAIAQAPAGVALDVQSAGVLSAVAGALLLDIADRDAPRVLQTDGALVAVPAAAQLLSINDATWVRAAVVPAAGALVDSAADDIVVYPAALKDAALALVDAHARSGLQSAAIDIESILDSFGDGLMDAAAVSRWLRARASAGIAPRYLTLLGAGHLVPRDAAPGAEIPVPLLLTASGLVASDSLVGDIDDDGTLDVAVGRIPAASPTEALLAVTKLGAFELVNDADAVFAADNDDGAVGFGALADHAAQVWRGNASVVHLGVDDVDATRSMLLSQLAAGPRLFFYTGHGGFDRLAAEGLVSTADVDAHAAPAPGTIAVATTCTINRYEIPGYQSLGAAWNLDADGPVAVYAPAGIVSSGDTEAYGSALVTAIDTEHRLGDAMLKTSGAASARAFTLLGDPALQLRRAPILGQPHPLAWTHHAGDDEPAVLVPGDGTPGTNVPDLDTGCSQGGSTMPLAASGLLVLLRWRRRARR